MSILVTGGLGYIGIHLVYDLLPNFKIVVLDIENINPKLKDIFRKRGEFHFFQVDISNSLSSSSVCDELKTLNVKIIVHLAALKSVEESKLNPDLYKVNLKMTEEIVSLSSLLGCENFVFSSSASVYGQGINLTIGSPLNPNNPYAQSKIDCENLIINSGLNYLILRYFNPIGIYSSLWNGDVPFFKLRGNLFDVFVSSLRNKSSLVVNDNENSTRDYIYIGDLCRVTIKNLKDMDKKTSCIKNVGMGVGTRLVDIIDIFKNYVSVEQGKGEWKENALVSSLSKSISCTTNDKDFPNKYIKEVVGDLTL